MTEAYGTLFNAIDIAALVCLIAGMIIGFKRGLSGELARLISVTLTLALSLRYFRPLADFVISHTRLSEHPAYARPLAFILILCMAGLFFLLLRILLQRLMKITFNPKIDRIAGVFAGAARATAIVILLVLALGLWPGAWLTRVFREESAIGRAVFKGAPALVKRAETALGLRPQATDETPQNDTIED